MFLKKTCKLIYINYYSYNKPYNLNKNHSNLNFVFTKLFNRVNYMIHNY